MVGQRAVLAVAFGVVLAGVVVVLWPANDVPALAAMEAGPDAPQRAEAPDTEAGGLAAPIERVLHEEEEAPVPPGELFLRPATAEERNRFGEDIANLVDDEIRGNATDAVYRLWVPEAAPLLYETLRSRDRQQRLIAAMVLAWGRRPATPRLAEVLVEAMSEPNDDELWAVFADSSARGAVRYLYHHPAHSRAALRRALWTGDAQQRFLAAFLLGCDGSTQDIEQIVRELIGHLEDNDTGGDGMMAAHALFRLGKPVVPFLLSWFPQLDAQARQLVRLILLDLEDPPITEEDFRARHDMHRVTCLYLDPIVEFDIRRSALATR